MISENQTLWEPAESDLQKATRLVQSLIRIDSSNPPGNETGILDILLWELQSAGITPVVVGAHSDRPNLVAKLAAAPENRTAPPLVLSCHMDVVPVANPDAWKYPPFSGELAEGCIWGRGAVDMKGFAVMALTALTVLSRKHVPVNRDVIFVAVSDEEAGTEFGSKWLVENRPDLLENPEYVLNEVGGFTIHRGAHRFYPVQVAEKGVAWLRLTARGQPGHSSMAVSETSLSLIADAICKLSKATLPWHVTDPAVNFLEGFTRVESKTAQQVAKLIFSKRAGSSIVKMIPDPAQRATVEALLRNTATPTRIDTGGGALNVLPSSASVDIDGRLVPGQTAESLMNEIRKVLGDKKGEVYSIEIIREAEGVVFPTDTPLFQAIEDVMLDADPDGIVIPSMIPGFTDSNNYAKLGATCYGFYPLKLDKGLDFASMFHGDNERIPEAGFHWGIRTLLELLGRFLVTK
ncbi:MAG: M20/M25/M40 family metallo-hydrolase [Verrucomicrobiales bacterium]|nr:M20/M25/M40 family metallo-hydrolase [Verrucomicrobiales bacterium]